ncbi:MAG: NAD-dependent epimerase/dehydratase family protein [Desulfovibrio sp.]|uniref:NAD-dependent epimerase/dehydratase family protein n=1 Tax=Desulfovibrio sp. 7SRBS1 TaxID=3378064 RepID=UPI003B3EBE52
MSKGTCLVTGCAGFIGSHLTEYLLDNDWSVVGVDNFFSGYARNMSTFQDHPAFIFMKRDIRDANLIMEITEDIGPLTAIFHLAAVVSVPYSVEHPEETMEINYNASISLLADAFSANVETFIFAGSAAEYSDTNIIPTPEDAATDSTRHNSPYGKAKYLTSKAVEASGRGCALRFFNIYGPRQDPASPYSGVISRFIEHGLKNKPLTVFGDGGQTRDFLHVHDAVRVYACAAGMVANPPLRGIYNVGTGLVTSILELAATLKIATNNDKEIEFLDERPGDIRHSLADISKLLRDTDFQPSLTLAQGLDDTVVWAQKELKK